MLSMLELVRPEQSARHEHGPEPIVEITKKRNLFRQVMPLDAEQQNHRCQRTECDSDLESWPVLEKGSSAIDWQWPWHRNSNATACWRQSDTSHSLHKEILNPSARRHNSGAGCRCCPPLRWYCVYPQVSRPGITRKSRISKANKESSLFYMCPCWINVGGDHGLISLATSPPGKAPSGVLPSSPAALLTRES